MPWPGTTPCPRLEPGIRTGCGAPGANDGESGAGMGAGLAGGMTGAGMGAGLAGGMTGAGGAPGMG